MSRSNTRHRRSQWKASVPALVTCANPACREKHLPHVACPSCGQYGPRAARRQVLSSWSGQRRRQFAYLRETS